MATEKKQLHEEVRELIQRDPRACEFMLGLFWAALSSYRHDTVLRPFPPEFVLADKSKDVDGLVRAAVMLAVLPCILI